MTLNETYLRSQQLDNIVIELLEALKWIRKRKGLSVTDTELEERIARRLAIGCIKQVMVEMHSSGQHGFKHRGSEACRQELFRRCEELRYTEVGDLMKIAMQDNPVGHVPHMRCLELEL